MLNVFVLVDRFLMKVLKVVICILMFGVMCILFLAVVFRYFLNSPLFWADELTTYSLVFITFLGAYLVLRNGKMVKVTFIVDLFPKPVVRIVSIIANLFTMGLIALIGHQGMLMTQQRAILIQKTVALRIPMVTFYYLIPVMSVLMIFGLILEILAQIFPGKFHMFDSSSQRSSMA